jgi:uncharacterized protein
MELRREEMPNGPVITGFVGRGYRLGERVFNGGVLLDPRGVTEWVGPAEMGLLELEMLEPVLGYEPRAEFILLGTGPRLVRPAAALVRALEARGFGVEAMDSRAAARAWGVLRQEDRQIVAAILPHR